MSQTDGPNPSSEPRWVESIHRYSNGLAHPYNSLTKGRAEAYRYRAKAQRYRAEGTSRRNVKAVSICMCKLPPQLVPYT
ncbi:hypothetical protein CsSME_00024140 [Camellia sinensis var. sinensis]